MFDLFGMRRCRRLLILGIGGGIGRGGGGFERFEGLIGELEGLRSGIDGIGGI